MRAETTRFVVVTGGPGSGKTTLIDQLEKAGFARTHEAGRAVIQDQMAIDGRALPWIDPNLFAEMMLGWDLRTHHLAAAAAPARRSNETSPTFFDRGVPDIVGYLRLIDCPVPDHVHAAAWKFRYHQRVFIAPPWPEIYGPDNERTQSLAEAARTYESMVAVYREYGYELVRLPRVPVHQRVKFVTDSLGET